MGLVYSFLHTLVLSFTIQAQELPKDNTVSAETSLISEAPKTLQKIVVTGSYIRRDLDEGAPSPVTVIDSNSAQEAGSFSASGAFRDNAVINSVNASNSQNGSTNVSFHGQSSANNLVLLNGMRLPKPSGGDAVNIDFIPASAIERIEILKDGASALYGSEALAGVVNIITKKEYDGANISMRTSTPQSGLGVESNVVATYGKNFKRGNILATVQYRRNEPIMFRDTEYGITNLSRGGSLTSSPGNLQLGNKFYRAENCPADQVDKSGACRYDYYNTLPLTNERDYGNVMLSGGYDLGKKLRMESMILYARQQTLARNTPKIINLDDFSKSGGADYSIDGNTANQFFSSSVKGTPTFSPTDKLKLLYSADEELGTELKEQVTNNGTAQVKIGRQSDKLDWDVSVGYGASDFKEEVVQGNARMDVLHRKLQDGSWRPFNATGDKGDLRDAKVNTWNSSFSDILNARLIASQQVLGQGPRALSAAYGLESQSQRYSFRADPLSLQNVPLTGLYSNQEGSRGVQSMFLELSQSPFNNLQLQAALRMDKYSDFGSTVNPKLGASYKITNQLAIRSSFGTGFKAPDLRSLYQGNVTSPQRFRDGVACAKYGNSDPNCNNLFSTTTYGNSNLGAEMGKHWNMGLQFRPKKNWTFNIDHWRAVGTNSLESINLNRLTAAEATYGPSILKQLGVTIQRDPNDTIQYVVIPVKNNSGRYNMNGLDLDLKFKSLIRTPGLGTMNFTFRTDHSHIFSSGSQPFFFQGYERQLDLNWRNVTSLTLAKGSHLTSLRARTYSARDKDDTRTSRTGGGGSIPMYTEYDLHYEYYGAWDGVITLGLRNLFDYKVYNDLNRGGPGFLLPASDTFMGRTIYAGYSHDF